MSDSQGATRAAKAASHSQEGCCEPSSPPESVAPEIVAPETVVSSVMALPGAPGSTAVICRVEPVSADVALARLGSVEVCRSVKSEARGQPSRLMLDGLCARRQDALHGKLCQ